MPGPPIVGPNAFKPRQGYYPNPVPLAKGEQRSDAEEISRYVGEELHNIAALSVGISGGLPLPLEATDALLIGRGDEIYTIDLWTYYLETLAIAGFFNSPTDILSVTDVPSDIVNWPDQIASYHFDTPPPNPITGVITVPSEAAGLYRLTCKVIFLQPSITQNFSYLLYINGSVAGDVVFDSLDINSNQTEWRSLGGSAIFQAAAGEGLKLMLGTSAGATPGVADFQRCSFEVELVAPEPAP